MSSYIVKRAGHVGRHSYVTSSTKKLAIEVLALHIPEEILY